MLNVTVYVVVSAAGAIMNIAANIAQINAVDSSRFFMLFLLFGWFILYG
jgi:hypothetical protein